MSSAIAFVSEGALPDVLAGLPGAGVGELLDAAGSPDLDRGITCRSGAGEALLRRLPGPGGMPRGCDGPS